MPGRQNLLRAVVHSLAACPLASLLWEMSQNQLGSDPATYLVHQLGFWGLVLLWCSLAMTPLRILLRQPLWMGARRPLGLWSFFYITLHLTAFILAWCGLDFAIVSEEITERPYVILGLMSWLLMMPLAATSTHSIRRRMGVRWVRLHRLVYLIAVLAFFHFALAAKLEYVKPIAFGIVLIFLFFIRIKARQGRFTSIKCAPLSLRRSKS